MATGSRSLAASVILSTKAALARCNAVGETWSPSLPIGAISHKTARNKRIKRNKTSARSAAIVRGVKRTRARTSDSQEAINVYNDLIRTHPQDQDAYTSLALLLVYPLDRNDQAIEVYKRAIKAMPKSVSLYRLLAVSLEVEDRMPEAEAILNAAVQKSDDPASAYDALGDHYCYYLKRCSDSIIYYKMAIERVDPNPLTLATELSGFHYSLGKAYLQAGDRSSAIKEYELLKSRYPLFAERLFNEIYK